ncbi:hypothetical protein ACIA7S_28780 [Streptomyces sp. NPDC051643]|uniref:hypothetical protein n=1 Tax=Streptomyces sp. NPDC051643 TaxID=3365665 RepID=UPI0037B216AD
MSQRDKRVAVLVGAVVGIALLNKVASKEARALGVSAGTLAVLGWLASQAV